MGIKFDWLIESQVIYAQYIDVITEDELTNAITNIVNMIDNSSAPLVHTLVDTTDLKDYPKNIQVVLNSTKQILVHPRYGWLIVYGRDDRLMKFLVQVATSMFKVRVRVFNSREESIEFLKYVDTSLQDVAL